MAEQREQEAKPRGYMLRGASFEAPALPPGLYVVATPIGNLSDISLRALDTLAAAHILACEDTRVTRKLLDRYGISAKVFAYHEHSAPQAHRRLLDALAEGRSVALVSDAGTPLVSDPGERLVADAAAAGHRVIPIPGPSSAIVALSAAGLPTDEVLFLGFLPAKPGQRRKYLEVASRVHVTLVFFESPNRIAALLRDAVETLGGERQAALCRELTKLHETIDRGTLAELAVRYAGKDVKGEIVLVVAPSNDEATPPEDAEVEHALRNALQTMGVKAAAALVADSTGLSRRTLYQRALQIREKS